ASRTCGRVLAVALLGAGTHAVATGRPETTPEVGIPGGGPAALIIVVHYGETVAELVRSGEVGEAPGVGVGERIRQPRAVGAEPVPRAGRIRRRHDRGQHAKREQASRPGAEHCNFPRSSYAPSGPGTSTDSVAEVPP